MKGWTALIAWVAWGCGDGTAPAAFDLSVSACDPVAQTCPGAAKCSITDYDSSGAIRSCVAATGAKMEDAPCARDTTANEDGLGYDDCAAGLLCSALGGLGTTEATHLYRCWRYCDDDVACAAGKKCISLNESPPIGVCVPTCTAFGSCPTGFNCSFILPDVKPSSAYLGCREPGAVPAGGECADGTQCAADAICNPFSVPKTCLALCDVAHPCSSGSCIAAPGLTFSVCL